MLRFFLNDLEIYLFEEPIYQYSPKAVVDHVVKLAKADLENRLQHSNKYTQSGDPNPAMWVGRIEQ